MPKPHVVVVAGPNGSGKSTLTAQLRVGSLPSVAFPDAYINADEIAVDLRLAGTADPEIAAFHEGRRLRQVYREARHSFAYETVLSHPSGILDLERLRNSGYSITLIVVTTGNPKINVQRVRRRVLAGGHDVPEDRIVARYRRCMELLPRAIETAHDAWIYDSTDEISLALYCREGTVLKSGQSPRYIARSLATPLRKRASEHNALLPEPCNQTEVDENAGSYLGTIEQVTEHYLVQRCPELGGLLHDRCMAPGKAGVGQLVRINYREGAGTIVPG